MRKGWISNCILTGLILICWGSAKGIAQKKLLEIPELVRIPVVTSFSMGRPNWEKGFDNEQPVHPVNIKAFFISKYEVTTEQYCEFLNAGGNDSHYSERQMVISYGGPWINKNWLGSYNIAPGKSLYPVVYISWYDAQAYCEWLSAQTGQVWRLPTEAEWEYAAIGLDSHRTYPWGNNWENAKCNNADDYQTGTNDGYAYAAPVGMIEAGKSPFGVYDMAGNVCEWVSDWYLDVYYRDSSINNPQGPNNGENKIIRGGSWFHGSLGDRCSCRVYISPNSCNELIGFRVVRTY